MGQGGLRPIVEESFSDASAKTIKIWDTDVRIFIYLPGCVAVSYQSLQDQGCDLIDSSALRFRQDTACRALSSAARVWQLR
jgi:hypothetical protein